MKNKKEFRIQVRTEVYATYVVRVNEEFGDSPSNDEEALEIALSKLDKAYNDGVDHEDNNMVYIEDTLAEFGGFTSIKDGNTVILGRFKEQNLE